MKKSLLVFLLIAGVTVLLIFSNSCSQSSHSSNHRGNNPWVFRSVLDQKARMVTVALSDSFWIAYDAKNAGLYKVWRSGVNFEGAVYNTAHGPQPTSKGAAYLINENTQPWSLKIGDEIITPTVKYHGHKFNGDHVELNYDLHWGEGEHISINEKPELIHNQYDMPGLERIFTTSHVPEGVEIMMSTKINSVRSEDDIETNGDLKITQRSSSTNQGVYILEGNGQLTLKNNASTKFTTFFFPEPSIIPVVEKEEEVVDPGLALLEQNDCRTCHNETVKTVGPSYISIAERYATTAANINNLANNVMNGAQGTWGDAAMTAHPDLTKEDAVTLVSYILSLDGEEPVEEDASEYSFRDLVPNHGIVVNAYKLEEMKGMPEINDNMSPVISDIYSVIHIPENQFPEEIKSNSYIHAKGYLNIPEENKYVFRLISDDGSIFTLDGEVLIDNDGFHGPEAKEGEITLKAGKHPFTVDFFQGGGGAMLSLQWLAYGEENFSVIPPTAFSFDSADLKKAQPFAPIGNLVDDIPGDGKALASVHPSFKLNTIHPKDLQLKVGGMDFLPDGNMLVSTWDPNGTVYLLENIKESVEKNDPELVKAKVIATGLAEPLGLKVVDGEIFVLQKQELTQLIDHTGDDIIDEYRTISNDWRVSANFHEFAFGLVYQEGYFYATLATAINPGGASTQPQIQDRGKAVKISKEKGTVEFVATGLRTPNGIGEGVDGELFIADNQGDWLPASKIIHLTEGSWYGSRSVDFEGTANLTEKKPVVWLPQDEIGNSPSQPAYLNEGPYKGQMIHGEVTHGGIKRVFVEKVNGEYQGCLFRFSQGLEAGVNRLIWGPDGALYIGGVGNPGNWSHANHSWYGLQRMEYNGESTFEMLAVRAKSNGMEIEFTEPLKVNEGHNPEDYMIQQWWYEPTAQYGGPKKDLEDLTISSVRVSLDRKKVFLELPGIKPNHVVYVHLAKKFISANDHDLWNMDAWYTLNQIPSDQPGFTENAPFEASVDNQLTEAERSAGWQLLFDGQSLNGWKGFNKAQPGSAWKVEDGMITLNGEMEGYQFKDGGDLITANEYENYELSLEWKISEGGNSGLIYNIVEEEKYSETWKTGPEFQILDNERHGDAKIFKHRSGDLYDLIPTRVISARRAGEWNQIRLIIRGDNVEHWQNGFKVVEYTLGSDEWKALVAGSKWDEHKDYGSARKGHIGLQDHGNQIWFKNIKIRSIEPGA